MRDSMQKIAKGHGEHEDGDQGLARHLTKTGSRFDPGKIETEQGYVNGTV